MKIAETRVAVYTHTSILKNKNELAKKASLLNMSNFEIEENLGNAKKA